MATTSKLLVDPDTVPAWLFQLSERFGDAEALVEPSGVTRTFRELEHRAAALSEVLAETGVRRGDRVATMLPNSIFAVELFLAVTRLGATSVGINTRYRQDDLGQLLSRLRPSHLVGTTKFLDIDFVTVFGDVLASLEAPPTVLWERRIARLERRNPSLLDSARPTDLAAAFVTSGSTGTPKVPAHTQANLVRHLRAAAQASRATPRSTSLLILPFCGTFGFVSAMSTLAGGGRVVIPHRFTPESASALVAKFGVTHVNGSDDMLLALAREGGRLSSWRYGVQADFTGQGFRVVSELDSLDAKIVGVYGSSETFALLAMRLPEQPVDRRALAGGVVVDGEIQVRVVGTDHGATVGELQFRGPSVVDAYLAPEGVTPPELSKDGWFATGDLATFDGEGEFTYLGRTGDTLRLSGFLTDPLEIEQHLLAYAGVGAATVVGVASEDGQQRAVAFVVANGLGEGELVAHCRVGLANYKVPARIIVVNEFPQIDGPNGPKISKLALRDIATTSLVQAARLER
jgi:acyl-CoA synthetase (AMP-forming)/AMP-acid ligase II